ncbi:hypothetical protein [Alteromonas gilva]|uniref:Uncharacterized protein n=1 Tax=Alteromonas gilva TaxID=2987522 RepID=A0ABT5L8C7_9ALTE|nr:hypothetical protein [Alteromonas gilva]MDC8832811.1 hypothetical protein [Alteromonas gilva]
MKYPVFVPVQGASVASTLIKGGSAIVGSLESSIEGYVTVYFEGNLFDACNLNTIFDRAMIAAGRLHQRYPTTAKAAIPASELIQVGIYCYANHDLQIQSDKLALLQSWADLDPRKPQIQKA